MVMYQGQVEITKTGWRVEWISPVNEGQFNRRKRRRFKKAIRLMSQAELLEIVREWVSAARLGTGELTLQPRSGKFSG